MPLKKMIDADKICADQLFLRESASLFSLLIVPNRAWTLTKILDAPAREQALRPKPKRATLTQSQMTRHVLNPMPGPANSIG